MCDDNPNITVLWGESEDIMIMVTDTTAVTIEMIIKMADADAISLKTANFVDGVAQIELSPTDTKLDIGEYDYQMNITYSDGKIDKLSNFDCNGECVMPKFTVCEALDMVEA